jgi:hypothetical protein
VVIYPTVSHIRHQLLCRKCNLCHIPEFLNRRTNVINVLQDVISVSFMSLAACVVFL